jgi:uncharacterized protein (TIGR02284 family)
MTTNDDKALLILNELLLTSRDSEKGFQMAADSATHPELVELFAELILQRARFGEELADRIRTMRGDPARLGNPAAALHRAWMELKAAIESNETHAILSECERGEDVAVKLYRAALQGTDLDKQSREIVQRQYETVQAAHDRIRQLRDSSTYAHR